MNNLNSDVLLCANADDLLPACLSGWMWHPTRTDDYAADCQRGRDLADYTIKRMGEEGNPLFLSTVARGMVEGGRWEAVEIGFFARLSAALQ